MGFFSNFFAKEEKGLYRKQCDIAWLQFETLLLFYVDTESRALLRMRDNIKAFLDKTIGNSAFPPEEGYQPKEIVMIGVMSFANAYILKHGKGWDKRELEDFLTMYDKAHHVLIENHWSDDDETVAETDYDALKSMIERRFRNQS